MGRKDDVESREIRRKVLWPAAIIALGFIVTMVSLSFRSRYIAAPGLVNGRLTPCPSTPNCVCSQDVSTSHQIDPIAFQGTEVEALERVIEVLKAQPRARIVAVKGHYVHAEFTSRVFRFVDDMEFLIDGDAHVIHVRSASRVGLGDGGVNRRRVESLRAVLTVPVK